MGDKQVNKQKKSSTLIMSLVALVMLLGVLISVLPTSAYFTSGDGLKIQAIVKVSPINFQVFQFVNSEDVQINGSTYIDIANGNQSLAVLPNVEYDLILKLKNADNGNQAMGVKYKIEMFATGAENNAGTAEHFETSIPFDVNRTTANPDLATSTTAGFWYNELDGYYYYVNNSSSHTSIAYAKNTNLKMMTKFSIPQSSFDSWNGENLKIVVTVEGINIVL